MTDRLTDVPHSTDRLYDASGRDIGPAAGNTPIVRPAGPWDANHDARSTVIRGHVGRERRPDRTVDPWLAIGDWRMETA
jgi:hypothetical protein